MNINIIKEKLSLELYGVAGIVTDNNWGQTGFKLMNEMWKQVKAHDLKNKGLNVWVYEDNNKLFAGVELEEEPANNIPLQPKNITLTKYVYYKHIGPYSQIGSAGLKVRDELARKGIKTCQPYIEIYGHWTEDETKLETELIWYLE